MTVLFAPEAEDELEEAALSYRAARAGYGRRFLEAVEEAVGSIVQDPASWPAVADGIHRRRVAGFPYDLIFQPLAESVRIVAVAHHGRRGRYWRNRVGDEPA